RNFDNPPGAANTMRKDLKSIADVVATHGIAIAITEQALGIYDDTDAYGDGEEDISAIIGYFDRQA
ncbi:MAG: NAD(P)-dependent oxidoreductase, partial [Hyphomicrobiales bacterium]|nr:NAD(P)-dependent oxidoreductase [Hyphomicrobiales bacterium]